MRIGLAACRGSEKPEIFDTIGVEFARQCLNGRDQCLLWIHCWKMIGVSVFRCFSSRCAARCCGKKEGEAGEEIFDF